MQRYLVAKNYNIRFPNETDLAVIHKTDRYGCGTMLLLGRVDTMPYKFENESFKSTVRATVHTNPSPQRIFSKTVFKSEEFENAGSSFSCGRKYFVNVAFRKRWWHDNHDNHLIFVTEFYSNTMTGDFCVHRFLQRRLSGRKTFHAFSNGVKPLFHISVRHLPE